MFKQRSLVFTSRFLAVYGLIILFSALPTLTSPELGESTIGTLLSPKPAMAQSVRLRNVWQQVYQQLPDFPREDHYISSKTGDAVPNNTLVSRLISYHHYVKNRPLNYRLDWKLTLADYLGVNEYIEETQYPSADSLESNPMAGDIAAINSLSRSQREALVEVVVNIFNPNSATSTESTSNTNFRTPPASTSNSPSAAPSPTLPQPGDAQLLGL
ncbi:MAG: hypothetical protein F6K19_30555 [Cyanothece sp. SIO1E1]|nr:hypothetical protein [Cyanothece sp. SIO1E1]